MPNTLLNLQPVEEIYAKAQFILEHLGVQNGTSIGFKGNRLDISGSTENAMLAIWFDARENTKSPYPSNCLTVNSLGQLNYFSDPHLSEKEAGEGGRTDVYLPWINWLNRVYKHAQMQAKSPTRKEADSEESQST